MRQADMHVHRKPVLQAGDASFARHALHHRGRIPVPFDLGQRTLSPTEGQRMRALAIRNHRIGNLRLQIKTRRCGGEIGKTTETNIDESSRSC